jgi:hypothetical protein
MIQTDSLHLALRIFVCKKVAIVPMDRVDWGREKLFGADINTHAQD